VFFGYVVAHRFFRERVSRIELTGMMLLVIGLVVVTLVR
jgi:multidrug transporter EmrE-like cation transporter